MSRRRIEMAKHIGNRGITYFVQRRLRAVAMVVVICLLLASLPVSSSTMERSKHAAGANGLSFPTRLFNAFTGSLASITDWVSSFHVVSASPSKATYYPVAHFLPAAAATSAPTNLTVTGASSAQVTLNWTAPPETIDRYQIERSQSISGPFFTIANVSGALTYVDSSVTSLHSYLYRVRAVSSGTGASAPSSIVLSTAISFEFEQLERQKIRAQNFYDVRTAINAVRAVANLPAAAWTRSTLEGLEVKADDVLEMRTALNAALVALNIPISPYEDPDLKAGNLIKANHIEQLQTRSLSGRSTGSGPPDSDFGSARVDPLNETGGDGENPLSRNFNWSLPFLTLPGRAGMDLNLTLSYNSLIWTRSANSMLFDVDSGFPGPGFRLGFPTIKPLYFNPQVGKYVFLLVGSDGSRTELRQVDDSLLFEAADSSYLLLDSTTMILRAPDGTQLSYVQMGSDFNCTEIKDRNGNYLTINYNASGRINTVVDTLARQIKFNYDASGWLTSITQVWNQNSNPVTHYWARFEYANVAIDFNYPTLTIVGPADGGVIKMLSRVKLADNSYHDFSYTSWGQVWKVSDFAPDNHVMSYRSYNLPQTAGIAHTDCPRFTERRDWAQYWNGDTDGTAVTNEEAVTIFAIPAGETLMMPDGARPTGMRAQVTRPDGTSDKIYFAGTPQLSGWQRGLPALVNTYDKTGALQRQLMRTWTQDDPDPLVSYPLNPRVIETNIYDPAGNRARVQTTYQKLILADGTSCHFPRDTYEYAENGTTILRSTRTEYNANAAYTSRRILGLVSETQLFEGDINNNGTLMSKVGFNYDEAGSVTGTELPVQHDIEGYPADFLPGRGNLSSIKRYNAANTTQFTITSNKYNIAGAPVSTKDPLNHEAKISYTDAFSDGITTRKTFAYPTTLTDPDGYTSSIRFNFDFGSVTSQRTPRPNTTDTNLAGPEQSFSFDSLGRVQKITSLFNNAYVRFEYATDNLRVDTYTTIQEDQGEAHSFKITDGHGRVIATANDHPGVNGRMSGQKLVYDASGRVVETSNPTETNALGLPSEWEATGDDAEDGWIFTKQTYDWAGRPLVTTNQDSSTQTVSYSGCGCAGGAVVTMTDEGTIDGGVTKRRQRKTYADVLGRPIKSEILNWAGGSVYSATVTSYNALDQVTQIREYAGPSTSSTYQDTTMSYDGYGRLKTRHVPQQKDGTNTTWIYNADDSVQSVTDARGAKATFGYNARHLVTSLDYSAPTGIAAAASATFAYDGAGNRTSMRDGFGDVSYSYDQLSRMLSETRTFSGVGSYPINYQYNLGGQLTSITNPFGNTINYSRDKIGRLTSVTGPTFGSFMPISTYVSNIQYRAWGATKHLVYGNNKAADTTYNSRMLARTFTLTGSISKSYDYHPDGKLRFSSDMLEHRFDRSYGFDHVGRMTSAFSGAEARGEAATTLRPYHQTYAYDSLNHLTQRRVKIWWNADFTVSDSYAKNRRDGWQYDLDGRLLDSGTGANTYDAAGRNTKIETTGSTATIGRDGDGLQVKTEETEVIEDTQAVATHTLYYLRSSVLGGNVLTEFSDNSNYRSFVYVGLSVLAYQGRSNSNEAVDFEHRDPSMASVRTGGAVRELDPFGGDAGEWGTSGIPDEGSLLPQGSSYNAADPAASYSVDGLRVTQDDFIRRLGHVAKDPTTLMELLARQTEKKLINVEVPGGIERKDFGLDYEGAVEEALRSGTNVVVRNWLVNDSSFVRMLGLFQRRESVREIAPKQVPKVEVKSQNLSQQAGFDNCVQQAVLDYRKANYPTMFKLVASTAIGLAVARLGMSAQARIASIAANNAVRVLRWKTKGRLLHLVVGGVVITDWITGDKAVEEFFKAVKTENVFMVNIDKCKQDFPNADQSSPRIVKVFLSRKSFPGL